MNWSYITVWEKNISFSFEKFEKNQIQIIEFDNNVSNVSYARAKKLNLKYFSVL